MHRTLHNVVSVGFVLAFVVMAGAPTAGARPARPRPPPPEGPAWQAWRDAISSRFSYRKIEFQGDAYPSVVGRAVGCPRLPVQPPGMFTRVQSPNQKIFGYVAIAIYVLGDGGDGNDFLKTSLLTRPDEDDPFPCLFVGDTAISMMQVGRFWIEVVGSCADVDLYGYEVGEVLEMVRQKDPAGAPLTFAYSPCGKGVPTVVSTESFLIGLKKKRSFWGRTFPAARDAAKRALIVAP